MKKHFITLSFLLLAFGMLQARPINQQEAQTYASRFVSANFEFTRQGGALEMVYQTPFFYVYNVGNEGFVIISSDDSFRPIIGYSDEGTFNPNDIPPALVDYFDGLCESRKLSLNRGTTPKPDVKADWDQLRLNGRLVSRNGGRGVDYLLTTKWNQDYPYNYCCPKDDAGPCGYTYVGCLATAMCQLTRYWAYPEHGNGSHCYTHEDYGEICADFEQSYYDWEHMPDVLTANSPVEEKIAVGTIGFHCGVTIDMDYGPDGSGGASDPIPSVMHEYLSYSEHNVKRNRNDYDLETWKDMVKEQFDMGWPMYYGGCDNGGCHAFNCDGYDDYDLFHFNLGWGGSSNGWYIIDEAPFTHPADAMFNFVPEPIYNATPEAASNFTVTPSSDVALSASLSWTNPSHTLGGDALTHIDQIVVTRNNVIIYTENNVTPGSVMIINDLTVPYYDHFDYKVQTIVDDRHGKTAYANDIAFGPTCEWTVMTGTNSIQGWRGGYITLYNAIGTAIATITMETATAQTFTVDVPVGCVSFGWSVPSIPLSSMYFIIKDANNITQFSFNGPSDDLSEGIFLETNNGCDASGQCEIPSDVIAVAQNNEIHLSWTIATPPDYGYIVYRDGQICRLVQEGTEYVDDGAGIGGHCYRVAALCDNGESKKSNESCATIGECHPPRYLNFEVTGSAYRPKLTWMRPNPSAGLSGYVLYRSTEVNEGYERIKLLGQNSTTYQDNGLTLEDDYYYKLYAVYQDLDCTSAPAAYIYNDNQFYLHVYYSPTNLDENSMVDVNLFPNPTNHSFYIQCTGLQRVIVYDLLGQEVCNTTLSQIDLSHVEAGVYIVRIITDQGECVKHINVVR